MGRPWAAALLAAYAGVANCGSLEESTAWDECVVQGLESCDGTLFAVNAPLSGTIPTEIGTATLSKIELQDNSIEGTLPTEIAAVEGLNHLDVHSNRLTGPIPTEVAGLTDLTTLLLHENILTGTVPTEFAQLTLMDMAGLLENQLGGSIPSEWQGLSELERIGLDFNQFTGTLPTELGEMTQLIMLNAVYNSLSGTLPTEYGQFPQLETLMLGRNHLVGTVPTEFGQLSMLSVLHLSVNSLTGPLPTELGDLANLTPQGCELGYPGFDKPQNDFTQPVPDEVAARCVVESFSSVPHDAHGHKDCGMCMRHRCTTWGGNKCASRKGYKDPHGVDRAPCMCACCGEQCGEYHSHCALHMRWEEEAAARAAIDARHAESPLLLIIGAVGGTAAFVAIVAKRLSRGRE